MYASGAASRPLATTLPGLHGVSWPVQRRECVYLGRGMYHKIAHARLPPPFSPTTPIQVSSPITTACASRRHETLCAPAPPPRPHCLPNAVATAKAPQAAKNGRCLLCCARPGPGPPGRAVWLPGACRLALADDEPAVSPPIHCPQGLPCVPVPPVLLPASPSAGPDRELLHRPRGPPPPPPLSPCRALVGSLDDPSVRTITSCSAKP